LVNTKTTRNVEGYWNINDFRDDTTDNSQTLFDDSYIISQPNNSNINLNKHWTKRKRFVDYWFIMRLIYSNRIFTSINDIQIQYIGSGVFQYYSIAIANLNIGDIYKVIDSFNNEYVFVVTNTFNPLNIGAPQFVVDFIGTNGESILNTMFTNISKLQPIQLNLLNTNSLTYKNNR
jgi:hypothetical protein